MTMINTGYITRKGEEVLINNYPDGYKVVLVRDGKGKMRKAEGAKSHSTMEQCMRFVNYRTLKGDFILKEDR